jgi:alpha-beta hydrolase superfamily lysophospholipase
VAAVPGDLPLRLIGTSTGALLCALYAERNPQAVESLFLMSPVRLAGVGVLAAQR